MKPLLRAPKLALIAVLTLAAAWKLLFLVWPVVPFNADEAVVALMARHILGGARPVFFYGQAYMGSLDAFLVALGFLVFGQQVWVIRLVQGLLYLGTLLTTAMLGKAIFNSQRAGILAALLLAVPTVNVMLYTSASLGGYGEALLIGNLVLLCALAIRRRLFHRRRLSDRRQISGAGRSRRVWAWFALWGGLAGCGLWANGLTLVYSLPAGLYLLWVLWTCDRKALAGLLLAALAGFMLGSLPWWLYAAGHGPTGLLSELFGSAVAVERDPWLARTAAHLVNFLLLGLTVLFGLRPPWAVRWLALPLLPFALLFWLAVIAFSLRRRAGPASAERLLLGGVMLTLLAGFLLTPFGVDPSGRYFLPLAVPMALFAADALNHLAGLPRGRWLAPLALLLVVGYQAWGMLECALSSPPGLTTQFYAPTIIDHSADANLMAFLNQQGETRGYANYWVSYPLAFESAETLLFVPRLPYHLDLRYTPRDDRYAPYDAVVSASPRVAYITTHTPVLDSYLQAHFAGLGVTYRETRIGDYHVFYRLSRAVRPEEIGLGGLRE